MIKPVSRFFAGWGKLPTCKYCECKHPLIDSELFELRIVYGNSLTANYNGKGNDTVKKINYCPMCGRKLGD